MSERDSPATDAASPVTVSDLTVAFGETDAVRNVDLTVEYGELVGLVGPNGAGKTTVLRAIKGTLDPDAGTVHLVGDPVADLSAPDAGRRVASVPQSTSLSFDFRVRHVVEMGRTPHIDRFSGHGPEDAAAVDEAMAAAGVERFADRSIKAVSGGERQRVLLARALAQETPVLVLDEPTASLDVNHAVTTLELVRELVDDGRAAIAAIHDLDMAARYCDRIVLLADGELRGAGPPERVLTRTRLTEAFDATAVVGRNPATGTPTVTAFPDSTAGADADDEATTAVADAASSRVHVVGGGLPAARVIARLAAVGYVVSVGPVPEGDAAATVLAGTDFSVAESPTSGSGGSASPDSVPDGDDDGAESADPGSVVVTVPAFETPDAETIGAAERLAAAADVDVAVGEVSRQNRPVLAATDRVVALDSMAGDDGSGKHGDGRAIVDAVRDALRADPSTEH